jgi:hypothetical protein
VSLVERVQQLEAERTELEERAAAAAAEKREGARDLVKELEALQRSAAERLTERDAVSVGGS